MHNILLYFMLKLDNTVEALNVGKFTRNGIISILRVLYYSG